MILSSCKKDDFTNPENLSGTVWFSDKSGGTYWMLKFKSKTLAELWLHDIHFKDQPEGVDELQAEGIYSIKNSILTIKTSYKEYIGSIEGNTIHLEIYGDMEVFTKE